MGNFSYKEIEDAFDFVSFAQEGELEAFLCTETGKIYLQSDVYGDETFEQLPDDIANDKYIEIPHKNEFQLGITLVMDFADQHLAEDVETIQAIFSKKGAYARFKDFLVCREVLDKWYAFEVQAQEAALREWCAENEIQLNIYFARPPTARSIYLGRAEKRSASIIKDVPL